MHTNSFAGRLGLSIAMLVGAAHAHAATIAYGFDSLTTSPTVTAPGTTAGAFTNWQNCNTAGNPGGNCGRSTNSGASGTDFTYFVVTPDAGLAMNLVSFSFDELNSGAAGVGPSGFDIYTSVDGFTNSILGAALAPGALNFTTHSASLTGAQFQGLTDPLTIRISGFGGNAGAGAHSVWQLDNVTLDLTTSSASSVPEPSYWLPTLLVLGLCGTRYAATVRDRSSNSSTPIAN